MELLCFSLCPLPLQHCSGGKWWLQVLSSLDYVSISTPSFNYSHSDYVKKTESACLPSLLAWPGLTGGKPHHTGCPPAEHKQSAAGSLIHVPLTSSRFVVARTFLLSLFEQTGCILANKVGDRSSFTLGKKGKLMVTSEYPSCQVVFSQCLGSTQAASPASSTA